MKKYMLLVFFTVLFISCGENKKAKLVDKQRTIKNEIERLTELVQVLKKEETRLFLAGDTGISYRNRMEAEINIKVLQSQYDDIEFELKKY